MVPYRPTIEKSYRLGFAVAYANLIGFESDRQDTAEDIAQDTILAVLQWIERETRIRGECPLPEEIAKYASTVSYRSSKSNWRRRWQHAGLSGFDAAEPSNDPKETLELIDRAVRDPRGREMLRMHVLDTSDKPRPVREYSRRLKLPPSTGCRVWNRALEDVRAYLDANGFDMPDRVVRSRVDDAIDSAEVPVA